MHGSVSPDGDSVAVTGVARRTPEREGTGPAGGPGGPGPFAGLPGAAPAAGQLPVLQAAWAAVEDAGLAPDRPTGPVGLFAAGPDAARIEPLTRLFGTAGPRWTGPDPVAAAVSGLRNGDCRLALVIATDTAGAVAAVLTTAGADGFGYPVDVTGEAGRDVRHLVDAALRQGRPDAPTEAPTEAPAEAPTEAPAEAPTDGAAVPLPLSAHSAEALRAKTHELRAHLDAHPGQALADVAFSLATTRAAHPHRAVVVARDREGAAESLDRLAGGTADARVAGGVAGDRGRIAFVCPGHGPQWPGMAGELFEAFPVFAEELTACARALAPHVEWPVPEVLRGASGGPALGRPEVAQPALWATTVALAALWRSFGVVPDAVIGSSAGEITAATVAGALSRDDGARAVAAFSQAQVPLLGRGVMLSVLAPAEEVRPYLARFDGELELTARYAPRSVVVSGTPGAATALAADLAADGVRTWRISLGLAGHSRQIDPVLDRLRDELAFLRPRPAPVAYYSATTGGRLDPAGLTADYWCRVMRSTVEFERATRALLADGHGVLLEVSPHPVLTHTVAETADSAGAEALVTGTLRRYQGGPQRLFTALGELYAGGVEPDWPAVFAGRGARRVPLPTYPFHAADDAPADAGAADRADGAGAAGSPLERLAGAGPEERREALLALVGEQLAVVLGPDAPSAVDEWTPLSEQGLDSVGATELRNLLNAATGLDLPVTLVFDHPTTAALTDRLDRAVTGRDTEDPGAAGPVAPALLRDGADEPIAVVAMSCRLPGGVHSPEELWELLTAGGEAYEPFPADRGWAVDELYDPDPGVAGRHYQREAGFLRDAGRFDASFFGISPREALAMDPQQRVLLEISWEALERAGIDPRTLRGTPAGVFVGAIAQDYGPRLHQAPKDLEGHLLTGTTASVASGRISYTLGLTGPAVTVDTACSSSLVALHLACQALSRGECSVALAGGVTVLSSPGLFVEFSRQRALAPDGRCKAFSAGADGFGIAEGAGMVVVERLSDARRQGHPVLAVIRGSAVNQDGASNGLTAPSGPSQRALIAQALAAAGLSAAQIDAVEAHGTGTPLGDPIEAGALIEAYGRHRVDGRPLWLGSLKSNIGHTQAAAGIAGVIKTVLALRHGLLPRTLHADRPSPHIDWTAGTVELLTEPRPWPATGSPRRAAVSSFGVSGTNAHAILEQAPAEPAPDAAEPRTPDPAGEPGPVAGVVPWVLSAKSEPALRAQARQLRALLLARPEDGPEDAVRPAADSENAAGRAADSEDAVRPEAGPEDAAGWAAGSDDALRPLLDVGHSLLTSRSLFDHRAVVIGADRDALLGGLTALAGGAESERVVTGRAGGGSVRKVVFVFPGQGSQWLGMGAGLWDADPVFRTALQECADALEPHVDWPVVEVVCGTAGPALLERVDVVQPALWAVMVSLAAVWRSRGVRPAAVVGHSQGEIAAACVAGALALPDAARAVALRSRALTALSGTGGMVSLALPAARVRERLAGWEGRIQVAAVNGPGSVVVAGDRDALAELVESCAADEVSTWWLPVDYASHSAHVERVREDLLAALAPVRPRPVTVPMVSTVTGEYLTGTELDAGYWYRNLRETVEFDTVVSGLVTAGHRAFVEVSPHPVLTVGVRELAEAVTTDAIVVGTLRRDEGGPGRLTASLAQAFVDGVPVDWSGSCPGGRRVDLPTYPFQGRRYWIEPAEPATRAAGPSDRTEDTAFWSAVERHDLATVSRALDVDGDIPLATLLPKLADWRQRRREESAIDAWRHRVTWHPFDVPAAPGLTGHWLLVLPAEPSGHPWAGAAAAALRDHGAEVTTVECGAPDRAALADRLRAAAGTGAAPAGVLSLLALDERGEAGFPGVPRGLSGTLALVGALGDAGIGAPLWLATRGAVTTGRADPPDSPAQAPVWGLGLAAGLEHPDRWGGLVDLPRTADHRAAARLAAVLTAPGAEDQLAVRPSGVSVRRITPAPAAPAGDTPRWRPRGTVLITGGTGALGGHVARWLAREGAEHLVLAGRRGPDTPGAAELAAELTGLGAEVSVVACDTGDRAALAALVARLDAEGTPVRSVFHAAGTTTSTPLAGTGTAELAAVLAAKATGAAHLDELLAGRDLDAFVLFSSASAVWGGSGLGAYSAANAFLDALAEHRRARGLPALSIAWGMWDGAGMSGGGTGERLRRNGLRPLDPARAVAALAAALGRDETTAAVVDVDWPRFAAGYTATRPRPLLDGIPEVARLTADAAPEPAPAGPGGPGAALAARLATLPEAEQHRTLLTEVRTHAAAALGQPGPDDIPADRPFRELGFDSLIAVEARNRLNEATGLRLPTTVVFDHPTAQALARHLHSTLLGTSPDRPEPAAAGGAAADDEPIAVVAMACRYPGGVHGPEDLWDLVAAERDAIGPFPTDRGWDLDRVYEPGAEAAGRSTTREGGFLPGAADFDADFFGISPREALAMDPQQRQILELSWEAFERAGIDPGSLRESPTAVFVGAAAQGYGGPLEHAPRGTEGYRFLGDAPSVLSGRVAYVLGLRGPALTVDTACSSSLVAIHLACAALRRGECSMALAGGAAVMVEPTSFSEFSRQGGLARDGRCKPFAEAADGTGWGEGAGLVVLERLSDARRNGHPVLAVVRATAMNQDGASNGLTAPSGPAQERVIRQALGNAGLGPADVDAVEAHGTGTTLGDPIEARALLATYGQDRPADRPLWLGSLKSNIGHTQWAAGIGGVIKMVQALRHGTLPKTLHVDRPSSHVDWDAGAVRLLTEARPWPEADRPRRAAVSSFGVSGTNAHAILEQAPEPAGPEPAAAAPDTPAEAAPVAWALTARTATALREQAARLHAAVAGRPGPDCADVAYSLATGRAALEHRAVVVGADRGELLAAVGAIADGRDLAGIPGVRHGTAADGKVAVLFSGPHLGEGLRLPGRAREPYERHPAFADALDEVCAHLEPHLGLPLREVLTGDDGEEPADPGHAQAALFAFQVALLRLWESWGLRPDAVAGHSVGELTAVHAAGALSLADASALVAARAALVRALPRGGAAVAVAATEEEAAGWLSDRVAVASVDGPGSLVLHGSEAEVLAAAAHFQRQGRKVRRLPGDHLLAPPSGAAAAEFRGVVAATAFGPLRIPVISTVTGRPAGPDELGSPDHWVAQAAGTVRFADAVAALRAQDITTLLEIGPGDTLTVPGRRCAPDAVFVPALGTGQPDGGAALTGAAALLFARGVPLDWPAFLAGRPARRVDLPTYAFQHERYWLASAAPGAPDRAAAGLGLTATGHPMLGAVITGPEPDSVLFTGRLSVGAQPWLADHVVGGRAVFPGTGFVELALYAAQHCGLTQVEELTLRVPLVLPPAGGVRLRVTAGPGSDGRRSLDVHARPEDADPDAPWTHHASGTLAPGGDRPVELTGWPPRGAVPLDTDGMYDRAAELGYTYGPAFRAVRAAWRVGDDVCAEVALPGDADAGTAFALHPALLDAALHAPVLHAMEESGGGPVLPLNWSGVRLYARGGAALRVRWSATGPDTMTLAVADDRGRPVASVDALAMRPADLSRLGGPDEVVAQALFELEWTPAADTPGTPAVEPLAVLGDDACGLDGAGLAVELRAGLDDGPAAPGELIAPCPVRCDGRSAADTAAAVRAATGWALDLAQRWSAGERPAPGRLVVLTHGAVHTGTPDPAQAAVWGLVSSAQSEHPERFVLVDLDADPASRQALPAALATGEPRIALRSGAVSVPRLARAAHRPALTVPPDTRTWRLDAERKGSPDGLALVAHPAAARPLAPGEVRIDVHAVGVNFLDVLITLDAGPAGYELGSEVAGVVTEVGAGVIGAAVGDRVMGLVLGALGPVAVADHRMVVRVPHGWSFVQAASAPAAFLTAYYALTDLARLRAGESVLVHAAAGGVGMAAVQLARHRGAEVFATASPGKWHAVRASGVPGTHLASSRDLEFADRFAAVTDGRGVDVVLNSLVREYIDASLRLLPRGGRFVEMGKSDLRDPGELAAGHPGVEYETFDLARPGPDRIQEMLTELVALFDSGALRPLPTRTWDLRRAPDAFRFFSQARHIGKLVLTVPAAFDPEHAVLVTGGLGTLGRALARHLATRWRARHLVLTARRGPATEGADALQDELRALGAEVTVAACDVSDRDAVAKLLASLDRPLGVVVHAAAVLDDGVLDAQTPQRLDTVIAPKVDGALHLDELTRGAPLSAFVAFSSVAGVLGGAGQAGYAAANTALDALVQRRRAAGLPGVSLAWGLWAEESGLTAALGSTDHARLSRSGIAALSTEDALALFDAALADGRELLAPVRLDHAALRDQAAAGTRHPLLRALVRPAAVPAARRPAEATAAAPSGTLPERLAALPDDERDQLVLDVVSTQIAQVLGHATTERIAPERALKDLGFDSLTVIELRNRLNAATGLRLPATLAFDHPTAAAIARFVLARFPLDRPDPGAEVLAGIERLEAAVLGLAKDPAAGTAADRVDARLRTLLARWGGARDGRPEPDAERDLSTASDRELFELLDEELESQDPDQ
ncbi:SDR family NAD(P)-dependent oxidoreductase [Streptomyces sp. NPDC018031]|uniref:SDR family NAD(P)-dependent oxidoreductase n=1 Tax=Streptomyces sp. NPDC018031 TaxID=3365033 RepID=UPI0037A32D7D